jgi:cytoskeletal protein CcmA (bactofilin family)
MTKPTKIPSIINKDQTFEGKISSRGKLIIHGTFKGKIVVDILEIYEEGVVHADIKAADITISGTFKGESRASNELNIRSTGNYTGKIICRNLVVEAGGILNAEVTCIPALEGESGKKLLTAP